MVRIPTGYRPERDGRRRCGRPSAVLAAPRGVGRRRGCVARVREGEGPAALWQRWHLVLVLVMLAGSCGLGVLELLELLPLGGVGREVGEHVFILTLFLLFLVVLSFIFLLFDGLPWLTLA